MKYLQLVTVYLVLILCVLPVAAHDTTHIHPMITARTLELIENSDADGRYQELYEDDPGAGRPDVYWGTDFDAQIAELTLEHLMGDDDTVRYIRYDNVMDGVVQEDVDVFKVLNHFHHAESGNELRANNTSLGDRSSETSMAFFKEAIEFYGGYTEQAKGHAYFVFGQALHHVEDMSSPAHIHNDAHITLFVEGEKDDYEALFLPHQKLDANDAECFNNICKGARLDDYFNQVGAIRTVNNPWRDIWGRDNGNWGAYAGSMVQFFYNPTTYQALLEFPTAPLSGFNRQPSGPTPAPTQSASGELQQMFPCLDSQGAYDETVDNCLKWVEDSPDVLAHWEIVAVGDFQHQFDNKHDNDWWPVEMEVNPAQVINKQRPLTFGDRFYLEQLATGGTDQMPLGTRQVVPARVRSNYMVPGSAMVDNVAGKMLLEIRAEHLLHPAVEFSAGFTTHWFDIANTPPYLVAVKAVQAPKDSATGIMVYEAAWQDVTVQKGDTLDLLDDCLPYNADCNTEPVDIEMADSRRYVLFPSNAQNQGDPLSLDYIHADKDLQIELEFNEPIGEITQIGLGRFDDTGACLSVDTGCLDFTPPTDGSTPVYSNPGSVIQDNGRKWVFELPAAALQNLNGKLVLTVRAQDQNNHDDGEGGTLGAELDGTPGTPARRNLMFGGDNHDPFRNYYPWHKDTGTDPEPNDIKYSYDPEGGDTNHVLLFDTGAPSAVINVDSTLPN